MLKMLERAYYKGKIYKCGEECNIDPATEERWIKNKIAEKIPSMDFSSMSDEELAEYAESIGVDISRCRSRESAEAKVRKAEQSASFDFLGSKVNDFVGITAERK